MIQDHCLNSSHDVSRGACVQAPVLLIDDRQAFGRLFELFFAQTRYGAHPFCFSMTLDKALSEIAALKPAVIFLDNYLPPYDDFRDPLRLLRQKTDAPIVLTTGSELSELGCDDLPDGLDAFLSKQALSASAIENTLDAVL